METAVIVSIILFIAYLICGVFVLHLIKDRVDETYQNRLVALVMLKCLLIGLYAISLTWNDYRDGQIDALKGKYQYRMEINYDQHGTPKDTIYVQDSYTLKPTKTEYKVVPAVTYRDTVIYINN